MRYLGIGNATFWLHPRNGSAGFIAFGWWCHIKAPWNPPLFSERHGISNFRRIGKGWRIAFRRMKEMP